MDNYARAVETKWAALAEMVEARRKGDGTWQDGELDRATMKALQTAEAYWIDPRIGRVLRAAADSLPEDTTFGPELFVTPTGWAWCEEPLCGPCVRRGAPGPVP